MPAQKKVKVGVVGCGVVATAYYLPYLAKMDTVDLVAVCDLYETRTAASARLFGAKEQYLDYYEMIDQADIDAVFILTAPGTHVPFTMKAVEAGKHMLIQKPMATNMDDARTIAEAVRKAGRQGHHRTQLQLAARPGLWPTCATSCARACWATSSGSRWRGPARRPTARRWAATPTGRTPSTTKDSGGFLFDLPYAPSQIVSALGPCKSVTAKATIAPSITTSCPRRSTTSSWPGSPIPTTPTTGTWSSTCPGPSASQMEADDHAYSLYEMVDGASAPATSAGSTTRSCPAPAAGALQVFGTEGNLIFGARLHGLDHLHAQGPAARRRRRRLVPHPDARRPQQGQVAAANAGRVQLLPPVVAAPHRLHPGGPRADRQRGLGPAHHGDDGRAP